jgi:hypothetical protein
MKKKAQTREIMTMKTFCVVSSISVFL